MNAGKLDRSAFKAQTADEASDHATYYKTLPQAVRLEIARYLNSVAFNYPEGNPPKLDKTAFCVRSRQ